MSTRFRWIALVLLVASATPADAGEKTVGDAYPLATCPVSKGKLGSMGEPVVLNHEGREIRLCCKGCVDKFRAGAAKYIMEIDAAIVAAQSAHYPVDTCLVSGKKLGGEHGTAIDLVVGNRLVRLCCGGCKKPILSDPAAAIAKLDAAVIAKQKASYPLDTCVITGKKLGDGAVDVVQANRLVRVCCKMCVDKVRQNPLAAFAKIDAAMKAHTDGEDADDDDADDEDADDEDDGDHDE